MSTEAESGQERGLRRELRFWEAIALTVTLIVVVVVFARVLIGSAPGGQSFNLSPFTLPSGVGIGMHLGE